ncbi:unnamed protein product [Lampetra planeri]
MAQFSQPPCAFYSRAKHRGGHRSSARERSRETHTPGEGGPLRASRRAESESVKIDAVWINFSPGLKPARHPFGKDKASTTNWGKSAAVAREVHFSPPCHSNVEFQQLAQGASNGVEHRRSSGRAAVTYVHLDSFRGARHQRRGAARLDCVAEEGGRERKANTKAKPGGTVTTPAAATGSRPRWPQCGRRTDEHDPGCEEAPRKDANTTCTYGHSDNTGTGSSSSSSTGDASASSNPHSPTGPENPTQSHVPAGHPAAREGPRRPEAESLGGERGALGSRSSAARGSGGGGFHHTQRSPGHLGDDGGGGGSSSKQRDDGSPTLGDRLVFFLFPQHRGDWAETALLRGTPQTLLRMNFTRATSQAAGGRASDTAGLRSALPRQGGSCTEMKSGARDGKLELLKNDSNANLLKVSPVTQPRSSSSSGGSSSSIGAGPLPQLVVPSRRRKFHLTEEGAPQRVADYSGEASGHPEALALRQPPRVPSTSGGLCVAFRPTGEQRARGRHGTTLAGGTHDVGGTARRLQEALRRRAAGVPARFRKPDLMQRHGQRRRPRRLESPDTN